MGRLFVTLQYLLPHHLLCGLVYMLARSRRPWLKNLLIRRFVQHFQPVMSDALEPDPLRYDSFNAFFTRALRAGARSFDGDAGQILCPCDGTVSRCGAFDASLHLAAKGHRYSLESLLGGDREWARRLADGSFATLYLAPYNYHRVHMPLSGRLVAAWHVPGRIFSVNATTAARVPGLFARNERVICAFEGEFGPFIVVLVGALFVASMSTIWHGEVTPWHGTSQPTGTPGLHALAPRDSALISTFQPRGAELGRFNMGSTVILLLPPRISRWDAEACKPGALCRVGGPLGRITSIGHAAAPDAPRP
jgi:phosphatidylserine decarboxylase